MLCWFKQDKPEEQMTEIRAYNPVDPQADSVELSEKGDRLMFRHNAKQGFPNLFIAPKGELTSGWVLGIFTS